MRKAAAADGCGIKKEGDMPMTKKVWPAIGNSLLGIWIACAGAFVFCVLPNFAARDLAPYTGTVAAAMKALRYGPCFVPAVAVVLTMALYLRSKRDIRQTAISVGLLMILAVVLAPFFYWGAEEDFLDQHVVYQGTCTALGFGVSTEGNRKDLYAKFACDNDPSLVFKVWDPEIIAYVADNPGAPPLQYRLSANHTLSPVRPPQAKK